MNNKSWALSEIVLAEKLKEKYDETKEDELVALNIFASQGKFDQYQEKFEILIGQDGRYEFSKDIANVLGDTLMNFNEDIQKNDRLRMSEQIIKKISSLELRYDGKLFHNIVYVLTES